MTLEYAAPFLQHWRIDPAEAQGLVEDLATSRLICQSKCVNDRSLPLHGGESGRARGLLVPRGIPEQSYSRQHVVPTSGHRDTDLLTADLHSVEPQRTRRRDPRVSPRAEQRRPATRGEIRRVASDDPDAFIRHPNLLGGARPKLPGRDPAPQRMGAREDPAVTSDPRPKLLR